MQKIRIEIPSTFPFSTIIPVRITDLNYGRHVGNDAFLGLVHEARVRYLQSLGYSEMDVEGLGLIMADAGIQFMAELFYGDEVTIEVGTFGFTSVGFDLIYRLTAKRAADTLVAGVAKTGMVLFDFASRRPVRLPEIVISKLQGL